MDTHNGIFLRHQKVQFKKFLFVLQYTSAIVISNCCFSFKLTSETLVWEVDAAFLAFSATFFLRNSSNCKKCGINCNSTWKTYSK
ncbi:hypothetical protein ES288_A12G084200v1 [Gossypium darwinii]|uniref:Uncharacterized protein n=1 Tax=Gossypium darwinii TaxID=34276 RepID=A0A5D2E727_GOSDA|nr:hypothetical protein ES288_A12G084200v1 [Gossypium darwinii]